MDEKQKRFLKTYLVLVCFTFLNSGLQYASGNYNFFGSLIFFIMGNLLLIWLYRQTNGIYDYATNKNRE